MESTITEFSQPQVTVGVDTHKQFHVAHAVDQLGRPLGTHRLAATAAGYRRFVSWAHELGSSLPSVSKAPAITAPAWRGTCALMASPSPR